MWLRFLSCLLVISLGGLTACTSRSTTAPTVISSAAIYLATQGNSSIQSYAATLSSGVVNPIGNAVATGNMPFAIALTPSLNVLFLDNNASDTVSAYTINSDSSLSAVSSSPVNTGSMPTGMAVDPAGKFLFVANQGSSNISVYSISGTSLQEIAGSPFTTIPAGTTVATLPTAVAVSATGNFLYVANNFTGTVGAFKIGSSGTLTALGASPYTVGLAPSGLEIPPSGAFLYVANTGSNNVSAFAICDKVVTTCANPNSPDGTLTPVPGSPFSAGLGPVAIAADPSFSFLYVLDKQSSQISEYSFGPGSGVLSPLSTPAVSTGLTPFSFVIIAGATGTNIGNTLTNPTDFVYVANNGASTVSAFTLNTTSGVLTPLGQPTTVVGGNPSAVAAN
ncbi:MAG TPA: beta-propeller fold lactonase family protein [Terriglobales bacterium]|nr:beta-propeller fold lactonase family protein [Terriglobales bacterium]